MKSNLTFIYLPPDQWKRGEFKHLVNIFHCLSDHESVLERVFSVYAMDTKRSDRFRWSLLNRVAILAKKWWEDFRPESYSEAQHLENLCVNVSYPSNQALCEYIAQLVRLDLDQN